MARQHRCDDDDEAAGDEDRRGLRARQLAHDLEEGRQIARGEIIAGAAADRDQEVD